MQEKNASVNRDEKILELIEGVTVLVNVSLGMNEELKYKPFNYPADRERMLFFLEDVIDEFCDAINLAEDIRVFLLDEIPEKDCDPEREKKNAREGVLRITEMIRNYERAAAEKREEEKSRTAGRPVISSMEESVEMLFYDPGDYRIFPFTHILRICPWLGEHSVIRAIPEMKDLYYLYQEGTERMTPQGKVLVGPVVVIRLSETNRLVTPGPADRSRIRRFMSENTVIADFEEGAGYAALRFV